MSDFIVCTLFTGQKPSRRTFAEQDDIQEVDSTTEGTMATVGSIRRQKGRRGQGILMDQPIAHTPQKVRPITYFVNFSYVMTIRRKRF